MGQQQLLLTILAVLLIGIAIVIAVSLFTSQSVESSRDAIISDLENLNEMAYQFYSRPVSVGGGGGSFAGYKIPPKFASNENGTFRIVSQDALQITFEGTSINGYGTISNAFVAATCRVVGPYSFSGIFDQ